MNEELCAEAPRELIGTSLTAPAHPANLLRAVSAQPRELLHVFPNFNVGGAQVRFAALVAGLRGSYNHTILALNGNYDAAALLPTGASVRLGADFVRPRGTAATIKTLEAELARRRPDLLLTYNWGSIEMALANLLHRRPHMHMEDGFGPEEANRQLGRRVWTRRLALGRAHLVVPSITLKDIATRIWGLDPRRIHHIANGVAQKGQPQCSLRDLGLNLPEGRPLIGWAGALRPEKNPSRLLRAFAPLKDQACLLIIGAGPEHDKVVCEAAALGLRESLILLGPRTDARDILMQCDLAALSSDTEQMPMIVLEAMDAGLPIVSCDVGDVKRMVASENRPFVTARKDAAMTAALSTLLSDARLRSTVGKANQRRVRTTYSHPRMVEAHGALIARLSAHATWVRANG